MLFALAHPPSLVVLVVSYVVGLTVHGWVDARVAAAVGDRRPRLQGRLKFDPRVHLDPFGVVAAAISGLGWARPADGDQLRRHPARVLSLVAGSAVNVALGVALLVAARHAAGGGTLVAGGAATLLQRGASLSTTGDVLALAGVSQLYLGVLALVPLPPLDGGRVLFGLAPRTHGWLRAEHQLVERNIGVAVLLALLIIPLGGAVPLLPRLLDTLLTPLVNALVGA